MIKFLQNGIKCDDGYVPVHYSDGSTLRHPEGTITIYAREYCTHLPKELNVINDSDSMTDYFETDRCYIEPTSEYYNDVFAAYKKAEIASQKRRIARSEKRLLKLNEYEYYSIKYHQEEIKFAKEKIAKLSA